MKTFDDRKKSVNEYVNKIKMRRRKQLLAATGLCLAVAVLAAVLFVPYSTTPPDVSMYADSEYYAIIQQLNMATYVKPKFKNNFQFLGSFLNSFSISNKAGADMAPMAPGMMEGFGELADSKWHEAEAPTSKPDNGKYEETTDNQVAGVIESDLMKRSDK